MHGQHQVVVIGMAFIGFHGQAEQNHCGDDVQQAECRRQRHNAPKCLAPQMNQKQGEKGVKCDGPVQAGVMKSDDPEQCQGYGKQISEKIPLLPDVGQG